MQKVYEEQQAMWQEQLSTKYDAMFAESERRYEAKISHAACSLQAAVEENRSLKVKMVDEHFLLLAARDESSITSPASREGCGAEDEEIKQEHERLKKVREAQALQEESVERQTVRSKEESEVEEMEKKLAELKAAAKRKASAESFVIGTPNAWCDDDDRKEDVPPPPLFNPFTPASGGAMPRVNQEAHTHESRADKDPNAALHEKIDSLARTTKGSEALTSSLSPSLPLHRCSRGEQISCTNVRQRTPIRMSAFEWASEVEQAGSYEELAQDGAMYKASFATMEAKIVAGIMNILPNDLKRNIDYTKHRVRMKRPPQMITGREIVWRIYDYNKISSQAHVVREFQDFINLELRGDNLSNFVTAWDKCLLTMTNLPTPDIMESTFRTQVVKSDKLKEVMKMYNWEINQKGAKPSYESLRRMVNTYIENSRLDKAIKEYDNPKKYGSAGAKRTRFRKKTNLADTGQPKVLVNVVILARSFMTPARKPRPSSGLTVLPDKKGKEKAIAPLPEEEKEKETARKVRDQVQTDRVAAEEAAAVQKVRADLAEKAEKESVGVRDQRTGGKGPHDNSSAANG